MIKDEALEIYFSGTCIKSKVERIEDVIDFMISDFESRVCSKCKHIGWNNKIGIEYCPIINNNITNVDTFYCAHWKTKC